MKLKADTNSYMQLALNMDGMTLYLMVPTYYDRTKKEWMGFVRLEKSKKLITGRGKDSKDLEQNFNDNLQESFSTSPDETLDLFKPLSYWSEMMESD